MSVAQDMPVPLSDDTPTAILPRTLTVLTGVTMVMVAIGLVMGLFFVGTDTTQGHVQRIFYIHMPSFIGAFLAFSGTVIGGVNYLRSRNLKWDTLAIAGVEVGLMLAIINLVTGSIWARPIWNTWWTWDPRLTSAAIMALTYSAYLMLRNGIENPETRHRFAAVYGIVAIVTALTTLLIIRVVPQTIHPAVVGPSPQDAEGGFNMSGNMAITLIFNMAVWGALVPVTLMWLRIRLQNKMELVHRRKLEILSE